MKSTIKNGIKTEWETYRVTECCEVEPEYTYGGSKTCPDCGRYDVRTIKGVRVADRYPVSDVD